MSILNGLNNEQRKAAEKIDGPLLILAGAGSGKTRTVTYRIAHMVLEKDISPYKILAVTFTNKAAKEMRERVESLIGLEAKKVMVSTFHSFGVRLLRVYATKLGYDSNFNIYDADDQKKLVGRLMKELVVTNKQLTPGSVVSRISKYKEDGEEPADVSKDVYNADTRVIAAVYEKYAEELIKNNAMDFADLLINTNKLLDDPEVLEKIQGRYEYVMVDEYQDTNNVQYQIITKIAKKHKNICVVGDEDQSIYGFRGANIKNILDFEKEYKGAMVVKLEQNYRSTQNILGAANSVIKLNTTSRGKNLWTEKEKGHLIEIFSATDGRAEADYILQEIIKGKNNGRSYKDYTVLYRTNAQSRVFEEAFLRHRISYKIFGGMQFYQRVEVKDILSYMRVINNPKDTVSLFRIINVPKRKIGAKTIEKISDFADENEIIFFEAMGRVEETKLGSAIKVTILRLYELLKNIIEESQFLTASEIYDMILDGTNYMNYLSTYDDKFEARMDNVRELRTSIQEMENSEQYEGFISVGEFLEQTALVAATDELDVDTDYVKLMTIHNSKGLEFPIVFLVGMEDELFPSSKADFSNDDLEEERRLCYVAITRAEEKLHISHASERMVYGRISYMRDPSRFLKEIDEKYIDYVNKAKIAPKKKESKLGGLNLITKADFKVDEKSPFKIGEKVTHKKFGTGIIKDVEVGKRIVIRFRDGDKKLPLVLAEKFLIKE
ncbi:MAG: UvrD-helicase domain-containing protein [Psychrilyobacter sp.]|uniref:ATP-dependent helicase n=1 Tax=Psychrilyobacter sp. TaxID=2586924 RepID=UPI003C771C85